MTGRIEGLGPPEPPERPDEISGPPEISAIGPVGAAESVAGVSPVAQEVERVLADAVRGGADNRQAAAALVRHLTQGWISDQKRDEVAEAVSAFLVEDPVFSQLLSRLRPADAPPSPTNPE